jgi:AcrR family transcriptional regulator
VTAKLHPTAQAMVDLAIKALEEGGEAAVRVDAIVKEVGVSITSLYHHFGDRDGLVAVAQEQRYIGVIASNTALVSETLKKISTKSQMEQVFIEFVTFLQGPINQPQRRNRSAVLGSALSRPDLLNQISRIQREQVDFLAVDFARLQEIGVIRSEISAQSIAFWITGTIYGKILSELDPQEETIHDDYVRLTFESFIKTLL